MKLSYDELVAEIYAVLKRYPYGIDLEVSKRCAREVLRAETDKEQKDREKLREQKPADIQHASDCALHNAPAYEPGECDCGAIKTEVRNENCSVE